MVGGGAGGRVKKREKVMCDVVGSAAWVGLACAACIAETSPTYCWPTDLDYWYRVPAIHAYMYMYMHTIFIILNES